MGRDINTRLESLRQRRRGVGSPYLFESASALKKSISLEDYQERAPAKSFTKYALGSMQQVDPEYTEVSLREAGRVKAQLTAALDKEGISHAFELQGSVACDIHIKGYSDVDLLLLDRRFFTYASSGATARSGGYTNPISYRPIDKLAALRALAEKALTDKFRAANVDISGAKAIKISEGSLQRSIDVVPSHWHDTEAYQITSAKKDRGVCILDKVNHESITNLPFLHIHQIDQRDQLSGGGLKKAIRLCKNVKADATNDGTVINLSSYDVAAIMWHSDVAALTVGRHSELAILGEVQRHLSALVSDTSAAVKLQVPDGTRRIFNEVPKLDALRLLSTEINDLTVEVAKEHAQALVLGAALTESMARERLKGTYVP